MAADKDQLHALLADYVEGSLSEQQIDEAEAYLAANPGVRSVVDKLMIDSEALRALPPVRSPVDYSEEVRVTAERDLLLSDASDGPSRRPLSGPTFALAAMLLLGLGLGGAAYWILANRPTTNFEFASTSAKSAASATQPDAAAERKLADDETIVAPQVAAPSAAPITPAPGGASPAATLADAGGGGGMARGDVGDRRAMATESPSVMTNALPAFPADAAADALRSAGPARRERDGDAIGGGVWPPELEVAANGPSPSQGAVPASVQAIVDAAPVEGGRRAIAVVVSDVAALEPMRRIVRDSVGLEQQAQNVYEKVSNAKVLAATLPIDLGPLVASDVPIELERRLRAAVAADRETSAAIYEVAPSRVSLDATSVTSSAEKAKDAPAEAVAAAQMQQRMQQMQQVSGAMMPRAAAPAPTSRPSNVDVFVLLVPATQPTTTPAE